MTEVHQLNVNQKNIHTELYAAIRALAAQDPTQSLPLLVEFHIHRRDRVALEHALTRHINNAAGNFGYIITGFFSPQVKLIGSASALTILNLYSEIVIPFATAK